tara:strand:- start:1382 stop:2446 length:1065 start_codon:yes stop_codon:yes gene_type:complete
MIELGFTPIGKNFPVFLHPTTKEEYALARTEKKVSTGHQGFQFFTDPSVTLEDDLGRRDLTINAIARDSKGNLIDPYNGLKDIENRILRHVSEAFVEDPLRVFRVSRFYARYQHLGFKIASETKVAMTKIVHSGEISTLSNERIWNEIERAMKEKSPHLFVSSLIDSGAFQTVFPELDDQLDNDHKKQRLLKIIKSVSDQTNDAPIRFATIFWILLAQSVSKPDLVEEICKRVKAPKKFTRFASLMYRFLDISWISMTVEPKKLLLVFKEINALKRTIVFLNLLNCFEVIWLHEGKCPNKAQRNKAFLTECVEELRKININNLDISGLTGDKIGKKLQHVQLESIKAVQLRYNK